MAQIINEGIMKEDMAPIWRAGALMVLGMKDYPPEQADSLRRKFLDGHGEINCAALLKKSHEAGIPRKEHCDGLVFEMVEALD